MCDCVFLQAVYEVDDLDNAIQNTAQSQLKVRGQACHVPCCVLVAVRRYYQCGWLGTGCVVTVVSSCDRCTKH